MKEAILAAGLMMVPIPHQETNYTPTVPTFIQSEINCLADNIYFESRSESFAGQLAVAHVVMNRVHDKRFPDTVCKVIHDGPHYKSADGKMYPKKNRCQFSWYCDGLSDDIPERHKKWFASVASVALSVYNGQYKDITEGATHYHADYVHPRWAKVYTKTTTIDTHIFYRWEK
jgi:spore germination cell wall hydrolase CwlJ-like protein